MRLTLLSVVQSYLNKSSDFYVDSIFGSDVSQQAAQIAEEVYYGLIQRFRDWQFVTVTGTFDALNDLNKPNYLKLPDNVQRIQQCTISYNNSTETNAVNYRPVIYLSPEAFLQRMEERSSRLENTDTISDFGGTKFTIINNKYPTFCTSFDGKYVVFDSYNSEEESTLQEDKSRVIYTYEPVFLQQDDFEIPLPEHLSELYRDMVIVECYEHILQQSAPATTMRRVASRLASAQQQARRSGSMNKGKRGYGRN